MNLNEKSKVLIIATIFSIISGVLAILISLYRIYDIFFQSDEYEKVFVIILGVILIGIPIVTIIIAAFEIFTAFKALKTNKKSINIWNAILNIMLFISGVFFFIKNDKIMDLFGKSIILALVLRIFGYFNQKKIDKINIKEENKDEFDREDL